MTYLSKTDIILAYPFGAPNRLLVYHDLDWWSEVRDSALPNPIKLLFDANIRENMPEGLKRAKGIYMFFVEPEHPFPSDVYIRHLLYVGRVLEGTTGFNFFKRFYKYVKAIGNRSEAPNIMRLTNLWPNHTHVFYFDLSDKTDEQIIEIESNIFNKIVPPLNEELHGDSRLTRRLY